MLITAIPDIGIVTYGGATLNRGTFNRALMK